VEVCPFSSPSARLTPSPRGWAAVGLAASAEVGAGAGAGWAAAEGGRRPGAAGGGGGGRGGPAGGGGGGAGGGAAGYRLAPKRPLPPAGRRLRGGGAKSVALAFDDWTVCLRPWGRGESLQREKGEMEKARPDVA
jgi:hypothetical protein